jgi:Acetamidase/Formamidase family
MAIAYALAQGLGPPPGFGFLRDDFPEPFVAHWRLDGEAAESKQIPGVRIPFAPFPGVFGLAPSAELRRIATEREAELAARGGMALPPDAEGAVPLAGAAEALRTVPPRETGGNIDIKRTTPGATILLPVYLRARLAGARGAEGVIERLLARARAFGWIVGWSRSRREAFCDLADTMLQARLWRQQLDTTRFRAATALLLSPLVLRRAYARDFVRAVHRRFDLVLRHRLERGFARHPNRDNPYARLLLLGAPPRIAPSGGGSVDVVWADAADHL